MSPERSVTRRNLTMLLIGMALIYAFVAGLRTVADFDSGWQLATGRWVLAHHSVFSSDVFSYTARGNPWVYPPLSGVLLYLVFLAGGYGALSWLGALACVATIALGLRRDRPLTALLAILAVPSIAFRTLPRADLFTTVLFALLLRILWQYRETGKARLWLLPAILLLWVNLHLGFVSGLGLFVAYGAAELADMFMASRRQVAWARLKRALPWMLAAALATLVNPWGWQIYRALNPLNANMESYNHLVTEWSSVRITPAILKQAVAFRDPNCQFWWLVVASFVLVLVALSRLQLGEAIFLAGATYEAFRHVRLQAVFVVVVLIVGGTVLGRRRNEGEVPEEELPWKFMWAAVALAIAIVSVRTVDLVTNRSYLANGEISLFGAGRSWWLPERATDFIRQNHLPANLMGNYNLGGYLVWRLYPEYPDYIDGRAFPFGPALIRHQEELQLQPMDSPDWQAEADRWKINTVIFSTARYAGLNFALQPDCVSEKWKPVYLDEVSMVLVRNTPENQEIVQRLAIDCRRAELKPPPQAIGDSLRALAERYNFEANAGAILYMLSRDQEAMAAYQNADAIFDEDPNLHLSLGQLYQARNQLIVAEGEYRRSIRLRPTELGYYALARLLASEQRYEEAAKAVEKSTQLALHPAPRYKALGQIELKLGRPKDALPWLDKAQKTATHDERTPEFSAQIAESRAAAYRLLGDLASAVVQQRQAVEATPKNAARWQSLADLFQLQGDASKAAEAAAQANALAANPQPQ
jgi:tetratricopeptide (TPR) repeat protein